MSDADIDSASQAGAGPGTLNTLKAHDDLDGAPTPAQQSAAGGPTMVSPGETTDGAPINADLTNVNVVAF